MAPASSIVSKGQGDVASAPRLIDWNAPKLRARAPKRRAICCQRQPAAPASDQAARPAQLRLAGKRRVHRPRGQSTRAARHDIQASRYPFGISSAGLPRTQVASRPPARPLWAKSWSLSSTKGMTVTADRAELVGRPCARRARPSSRRARSSGDQVRELATGIAAGRTSGREVGRGQGHTARAARAAQRRRRAGTQRAGRGRHGRRDLGGDVIGPTTRCERVELVPRRSVIAAPGATSRLGRSPGGQSLPILPLSATPFE